MSNGQVYQVDAVGALTPKAKELDRLSAGEVGYLVANIKVVADTKIGDTITEHDKPTAAAFPGFQEIKPMVFAGLYPVEPNQYEGLRDALEKLRLNDSSFFYEPETSTALGFGFRCGFLGLLHMEIIQERLEREFQLSLITTAPSVRFRITRTNGVFEEIDNPTKFPEPQVISKIEEPIITALIMSTDEFVGQILKLVEEKRGIQKRLRVHRPGRVFTYECRQRNRP
jgi:GTP-binding protein LepA